MSLTAKILLYTSFVSFISSICLFVVEINTTYTPTKHSTILAESSIRASAAIIETEEKIEPSSVLPAELEAPVIIPAVKQVSVATKAVAARVTKVKIAKEKKVVPQIQKLNDGKVIIPEELHGHGLAGNVLHIEASQKVVSPGSIAIQEPQMNCQILSDNLTDCVGR